jgi:hypothetical protein
MPVDILQGTSKAGNRQVIQKQRTMEWNSIGKVCGSHKMWSDRKETRGKREERNVTV